MSTEPEAQPVDTQPPPVKRRFPAGKATLLDLGLALLLFALGLWAGSQDVGNWLGQGAFNQHYFAPSAMLACGRGYENPSTGELPVLESFLIPKGESFDCNQLPARISTQPLNAFQRLGLYLLLAVSACWAVGGVSWAAVTPLFALFYGLSSLSAYALLRLAVGRAVAVLGTIWFTFSATQLVGLASLRDYSKTPFILAGILLIAFLIKRPLGRRTLIILSVSGGLMTGIGIGFRTDQVIILPAFVLCILCFLPGRAGVKSAKPTMRDLLISKIFAISAFVLAFLIAGWPIFANSVGGESWDNALLGFMAPFDDALGVSPSVYSWGHLYRDQQVQMLNNVYAAYAGHAQTPLSFEDPLYDRAGAQYFFSIVTNFPADMLTRLYAAVLRIADMPFWNVTAQSRYLDAGGNFTHVNNPDLLVSLMAQYRGYYQFVTDTFRGLGILPICVTLLIVSRRSLRLALFLLCVLLYFGGYVMLQFQTRQYFHLEFLPIFAACFVVQQLATLAVRAASWALARWRSRREAKPDETASASSLAIQPRVLWDRTTMQMVAFAVGAALLILVPLLILRAYQQGHVRQLLEEYDSAPRDLLKVAYSPAQTNTLTPLQVDTTQIEPQGFAETKFQDSMHVEYLMVEISQDHSYMPVTFRYEVTPAYPSAIQSPEDLSTRVTLQMPLSIMTGGTTGTTRIFAPIYASPELRFKAVEIPNADLHALKGIYRLRDSNRFPLLWITLNPNWRQEALFEKVTKLEEGDIYTAPPGANAQAVSLDTLDRQMSTSDIADQGRSTRVLPNDLNSDFNLQTVISQTLALPVRSGGGTGKAFARFDGNVLRVNGNISSKVGNLLRFKPVHAQQGDYLSAEGFLYWGCFDLILSSGKEFIPVMINQPGDFKAALEVPATGDYTALVASCFGDNNYMFNRIGWKH